MIKEAFGEGATYEDAQRAAKDALGSTGGADVQYEIIEMPKKKVLGMFGGSPAKVRAFCEIPDTGEAAGEPVGKSKPDDKEEAEPDSGKNSSETTQPGVEYTSLPKDSPAYRACDYLREIVGMLGARNLSIKVSDISNGCRIDLDGANLGAVIGRRGETSDALQYLASLAANPGKGGYFRVVLNVGNYREKRESALKDLARRTAEQCLRTRHDRTLEPMNPYERRIIHTAVHEIAGVTSSSVGEGLSRRVVISVENGYNGNDDNRDDTPRPVKKDSDSFPLYGKIR